jgi:hypothetical protein
MNLKGFSGKGWSGDTVGTFHGTRTTGLPILAGIFTLAFSLLAAACGSDSTETVAPSRPGPTIIQVEPLDMTTAIGDAPMQLVVYNSGLPVGEALLNEIAQSTTLSTWPEQAAVTTASTITDTSGRSGEDQYAHIHLSPATQLEDRWYALLVGELPKGVSWPTTPNLLKLPGGVYAARFRTGSGPVVAEVRINAKGSSSVYLDFSEKVTGDSTLASVSCPEDGSVKCTADSIGSSTEANGDGGSTSDNGASSSIRFRCQPSFDLNKSMQIHIQPGLESVTGMPLAGGAEVNLVVQPNEWLDLSSGDTVWKPPM